MKTLWVLHCWFDKRSKVKTSFVSLENWDEHFPVFFWHFADSMINQQWQTLAATVQSYKPQNYSKSSRLWSWFKLIIFEFWTDDLTTTTKVISRCCCWKHVMGIFPPFIDILSTKSFYHLIEKWLIVWEVVVLNTPTLDSSVLDNFNDLLGVSNWGTQISALRNWCLREIFLSSFLSFCISVFLVLSFCWM